MCVVEFQERGLLPVPCIFTDRQSQQRLKPPQKVYGIVCTKIRTVKQEVPYGLVLKTSLHKTHGPFHNPSAFCVEDGTCRQYPPKEFVFETCSSGGDHSVG